MSRKRRITNDRAQGGSKNAPIITQAPKVIEEEEEHAASASGSKLLERTFVVMVVGGGGLFLATVNYASQAREGRILLLVSVVLLILAAWFFVCCAKRRKEIRKMRLYASMAVACLLGMTVLGCTHVFLNKPTAETSHERMRRVLVDDSFANSIIIVLRRGRFSLPEDTQCELFRQQSDGTWSIERTITIDSEDCLVVRALKPGSYRAELTFYGVRQDVVDGLVVGPQKGQYVELRGQGRVGCLKFKVLNDSGIPLTNAYVVLYSQKDFPVRENDTNALGETPPRYVASVLYPGDYYVAKVFHPGKTGIQVGKSEKVRADFRKQRHTRTILIRTNAN